MNALFPVERFIAIAEEVGLIHALAGSLLRKACRAASGWLAGTALSIDICPGQLRDHMLPERIARVLFETLAKEALCREPIDAQEALTIFSPSLISATRTSTPV